MLAGSRLERILVERADRIVDTYAHFLVPGDSWLSVGDGDGYVSLQTQRRCGVRARGLDVAIDWPNRTGLVPIDHYGGREMPYEENSFDVVSAIFTLHHCDDVRSVLSEMVRVSRKKIVICEDVYRTWLGRRIVCLMDRLENRAVSKEINLPFNFKKVPEWEALFGELGLSITTSRGFKIYPRFPVRHHLFCLET
jgi:SAM-dependent methyltransferase